MCAVLFYSIRKYSRDFDKHGILENTRLSKTRDPGKHETFKNTGSSKTRGSLKHAILKTRDFLSI